MARCSTHHGSPRASRSHPSRAGRFGALVGVLIGISLAGAVARPALAQAEGLTAEHCKLLQGQRDQLAEAGALGHMKQGPDWARDNLTPSQIGRVGAFIKLEEQLKFRCPVGFANDVVAGIRVGRIKEQPALPGRLPPALAAKRRALAEARAARAAAERALGNRPPPPVRNERRTTGRAAPALRGAVRPGRPANSDSNRQPAVRSWAHRIRSGDAASDR